MTYRVVGVMSGTSLDGLDLACVRFEVQQGRWSFALEATETRPYTPAWTEALRQGIHLEGAALTQLDTAYTLLLAEYIQAFITQHQLTGVDLVASHGHTLKHRPDLGYTVQIGNRPELAQRLQVPVACDFRVQDVELGGQGAPLVPLGDRLLFADYDVCLNLGGFSNLSYDDPATGWRRAFDASPVNTVLNALVAPLGWAYDRDGALARQGKVHSPLLAALNALPYYAQLPPKSLGMEWVNQYFMPLVEGFDMPLPDRLATLVEHMAQQIAAACPAHTRKVLVTGGGAYHQYLMERLRAHGPHWEWVVPQADWVGFKEALIFALLGVLRWRKEVNVLASVTGAAHDHCSGQLFLP